MNAFVLSLALLATGCTLTVQIPEEKAFHGNPKAPVMAITWIAVDDPTSECKRLLPKDQAFHPVVAACASWDFEKRKCTIVTGKPTSHQVLGHEVRHCFEGAFHD